MDGIYEKYKSRGGKVVFQSSEDYLSSIKNIYNIAMSQSYVRDMELFAQLSNLLVLLMKDSWNPGESVEIGKRSQIGEIRSFIDENYNTSITLDLLSNHFYINKTYLAEIFKEQYGVGVNEYLIEKRITKAKEMLRFTEMTMDEIAEAIGVNGAPYFSRMFKKTEGISPREWRNAWNTKGK
jgi:YesN/AraC family two-component response regulator